MIIHYDSNGQIWYTEDILGSILVPSGYGNISIPDSYDYTSIGNTHYVDAGSLVEILPAPNYNYDFDFSTKTWIDRRVLADAKSQKIVEFKELAVVSHFVFLGHTFIRTEAFAAISAYVAMNNDLPNSYGGQWLDSTDITVAISNKQDWKNFYSAYVEVVEANINKLILKITEINACTTIAEVDAIVW